jgi:kynurenine formamidase
MIDVREQAQNPDPQLIKEAVLAWETQYGQIPEGHAVLLYTGQSENWIQDFSVDPPHPTAQFLLQERKVAGIGTDRVGLMQAMDVDILAQIMSKLGGMAVDGLINVDQVPPVGANLSIGVLHDYSAQKRTAVTIKAYLP